MSKRLTPSAINCDPKDLSDALLIRCMAIEDALQLAGAKPETDYTYKDLMNWAVKLAASVENEFAVSWTEPLPDHLK